MNKIKYWSINLSLLFLSIILILLVTETVLRFTKQKTLLSEFEEKIRNYYRADKINGFDISKNFPNILLAFRQYSFSVWSNELGCFDKPYKCEKNYILLVGDSFTWGHTPFENKWGNVIENYLEYRVLKCGVSGYGTKQEYFKIKKVIEQIKKLPKLIIVGYFIGNDFTDDVLFPNYTVVEGYVVRKNLLVDWHAGGVPLVAKIKSKSTTQLKREVENWIKYGNPQFSEKNKLKIISAKFQRWLSKHSIIYCYLKKLLLRWKIWEATLATPESELNFNSQEIKKLKWLKKAWKNHLENFKKIKHLADKNNSKLLVVIIPWNPNEIFKTYLLTKFFKKERINYINLCPLFIQYVNKNKNYPSKEMWPFKNSYFYWEDDAHWNINGNKLAGLLVSRHILKNNLVKSIDTEKKLRKIESDLTKFKSQLLISY